jgi:hypothetical protein
VIGPRPSQTYQIADTQLRVRASSSTSLIVLDAIVLELMRAVPDLHRMMLSRHTNLQ